MGSGKGTGVLDFCKQALLKPYPKHYPRRKKTIGEEAELSVELSGRACARKALASIPASQRQHYPITNRTLHK